LAHPVNSPPLGTALMITVTRKLRRSGARVYLRAELSARVAYRALAQQRNLRGSSDALWNLGSKPDFRDHSHRIWQRNGSAVEPPGGGRQHAGLPFRKPIPLGRSKCSDSFARCTGTEALRFNPASPAEAGVHGRNGSRLSPGKRGGGVRWIIRLDL